MESTESARQSELEAFNSFKALDGRGVPILCPNGSYGIPCISDGEYTYPVCSPKNFQEARHMLVKGQFASHVTKFLVILRGWEEYKRTHKVRHGLKRHKLI